MSKRYVLTCFILVLASLGAIIWFQKVSDHTQVVPSDASKKDGSAKVHDGVASEVPSEPIVPRAAETTQQSTAPLKKDTGKTNPNTNDPFDYGVTPRVKGDANETVKSVIGAAKSKTHPERLSALIMPAAFDPKAYKQNPGEYLKIIEPARCYQPLQPAPEVPKIQALGPLFQRMNQGDNVELQVRAVPKYPVTWTSFDNGQFSNQLTSITVEADENGIAATRFSAPAGTIADVHIVCAAPMASGQLRFLIRVAKPGND